MIRAVVDTNLFVSSLITPGGTAFELLERWRRREFQIAVSVTQRLEIEMVLSRPKLLNRFGIAQHEVDSLLKDIDRRCESVVVPAGSPIAVRDPKDDAILALAITARVDLLITGDLDHLTFRADTRLAPLQITTVAEFLASENS